MTNTMSDQDREANYFAMCLLVPEPLLRKWVEKLKREGSFLDLCDDKSMLKLARVFQVSITIISMRLAQVYTPQNP